MKTLKVGEFRQRIIIQQNTPTANSIGELVSTWTTFLTVWAFVEPRTGGRFWEAQQPIAEVDGVIHIRYQSGITAAMRVLWGIRIFKIQAISNNEERNRDLLIFYKEIQP